MEQSPIHGVDQQERLLCWMGGIIDGEGCITINHHRLHKQTNKETVLFTPVLVIANTNKILIDQCCEIFTYHHIPFHIQYQPGAQTEKFKSSNGGKRKDRWYIQTTGLRRVARALNIFAPYIISKKHEASLVKEFCDKRLSMSTVRYKHYDDKDFEIIEAISAIHDKNPQRLHAEILEYKSRNKI